MFFLYIFIVLAIIIVLIKYSRIHIEIKNIRIFTDMEKILIKPNYEVIIKIYVLGNMLILNKKIKAGDFRNKNGLKKLKEKLKFQKNKEKYIKVLDFKTSKYSKIKIKQTDIKLEISTEDAALTAKFVGILYAIIPNLLNYFFELDRNIYLKIHPLYQDKNKITLSFEGIFEFNLIHIINTYNVLVGKERKGGNNGASDRKSYAYNNE